MSKHTKAINKLSQVHLKISQSIGFSKFFLGEENEEEVQYLEEIEKEIRESLELLGYDVNELLVKPLE